MNLKEIRERKKIKQVEVAKALNLPNSTYNGYEKETSQPNIETIIKLAKYFNVSTDELLGVSKTKNINLTEKNALLETIDSLTEIECHKLKIFAEGLISNRIEKTSAFKVLKDDRE